MIVYIIWINVGIAMFNAAALGYQIGKWVSR